ncbi:TerB family tellurite resistance protein [bacterium]|nr:MAG: TerB family tellurite resistance protein [bacterium]
MKLTLREKSECFRGFLLLIAQDRIISPEEKELLRHIGKALDFEKRFCEEAMDDLLENAHIPRNPPIFSRQEYAEAFLCDCIRIAGVDQRIHPDELAWLTRIAQANGLTASWVEETVKKLAQEKSDADSARMKIEAYI